mmetsp:Transcript_17555/g.52725  ORF Transcript_17555/g.52725 Transcript_17555/m.52725 type:complete len:160 (+) Transcript_17555:462-941(+)
MSSPGTMRPALLRLQSDLRAINTDPPDGCSASPANDDMLVWNATIMGPPDTAWEGGIFSLRLTFSDGYPNRPPKVRFSSPMYHANVYPDGTLCLDTIQEGWSPCQSVSTLLTSVQSLLTDPNCSSPANTDAARLYLSDEKAYNRKVKQLAQRSLEEAFS